MGYGEGRVATCEDLICHIAIKVKGDWGEGEGEEEREREELGKTTCMQPAVYGGIMLTSLRITGACRPGPAYLFVLTQKDNKKVKASERFATGRMLLHPRNPSRAIAPSFQASGLLARGQPNASSFCLLRLTLRGRYYTTALSGSGKCAYHKCRAGKGRRSDFLWSRPIINRDAGEMALWIWV